MLNTKKITKLLADIISIKSIHSIEYDNKSYERVTVNLNSTEEIELNKIDTFLKTKGFHLMDANIFREGTLKFTSGILSVAKWYGGNEENGAVTGDECEKGSGVADLDYWSLAEDDPFKGWNHITVEFNAVPSVKIVTQFGKEYYFGKVDKKTDDATFTIKKETKPDDVITPFD